MLGVIGSRFLRSIASTSYRNASTAAAAQESPFADIVTVQPVNEEDKLVVAGLVEAFKGNQPPSESLKNYDGPFTLEGVSKAMWRNRDVERARAVLDWASRQPGFYYTSRLMTNILRGCNAGGKLHEARIEELQEKFKPTPAVYNSLARLYMNADKLDAFKEVVEEMQKQGIEPDDNISFDAKLREYSGGREQEMLEMFREKLESGWVPNLHIVAGVISRLCGSKMPTVALDVYNVMRSKEFHPDELSMCVLMKGLCEAKKVDEGYTVAKHLLERGFKSSTPPFKTVIQSLCDAGRVNEAYEVFKAVYGRVFLKGVDLVLAFCKAGNSDVAMEVLDKLQPPNKKNGYFKDIIVVLCDEDRLEDARKVMDRMLEAGFCPDGQICSLIAEGYAKTLPEDDPRRKKFAAQGTKV